MSKQLELLDVLSFGDQLAVRQLHTFLDLRYDFIVFASLFGCFDIHAQCCLKKSIASFSSFVEGMPVAMSTATLKVMNAAMKR